MSESETALRLNVKSLLDDQRKRPADLARHLGKTAAWVSQFLSGRNSVPIKSLTPIAEFFGVSVDALLRSPQPGEPEPTSGDVTPIAAFLIQLRESQGFPNTHAAVKAAATQKIPGLTWNILWRAETGLVQMPRPSFVRAIAKLYKWDYATLAAQIAALVYQFETPTHTKPLDQLRHTGALSSPHPEANDGTRRQGITATTTSLSALREAVDQARVQLTRADTVLAALERAERGTAAVDSGSTGRVVSTDAESRRIARAPRTGAAR